MNPPASAPKRAKISELARLAGVPAPTIKHYMREGLLPGPTHRSSRNMAWYDVSLAERVRVIKELQQTHFLPLRIIAEILEPAPSATLRGDLRETVRRQLGSLEPAVREGHIEARAGQPASSYPVQLTRSEVLATMQLTEEELGLLESMGLLEPSAQVDGEPAYGGPDLDMLAVIHDTRESGLGELFKMAVLGPYLARVREIARFELDLFRDQVLADSELPPSARRLIAKKAVTLGARLLVAMRNKVIITELRGMADRMTTIPPPPPPAPPPAAAPSQTPRRGRTRRQGD